MKKLEHMLRTPGIVIGHDRRIWDTARHYWNIPFFMYYVRTKLSIVSEPQYNGYPPYSHAQLQDAVGLWLSREREVTRVSAEHESICMYETESTWQ